MKQILMEQVKGFVYLSHFVTILIFKSSKATEPVSLTTWADTLSSPNYPFTYPANSSLTWIKSVSTGNRIQITVYDLRTQCDGDYLEIRDGDSLGSPLVARYCGVLGSAPVITSSGTHMLLHFVSDDVTDISHRGFTLRHTGVCNVHTNATSGVITTPNYPDNYPNYMDCLWTIQLHPSILITLECQELALEYNEGCTFDYMEILAGVTLGSSVLGRYCGVYKDSLTFERDGNMSIRFVSDKDNEFHGFRCEYNIHKVRGDWTEWTDWTECSRTCRHGNQTRYRTCVNPLPESGLQLLCGDVADTERRNCLISNCTPIDGSYTNWSNWSACNVTCGTGVRRRSRNCTNPPPAFTGKNCSELGEPWESAECVLAPCPGVTSRVWISSYIHPPLTSASSYSGTMSYSDDSHVTPFSNYALVTHFSTQSSTHHIIPSSQNVSLFSSTTVQNEVIEASGTGGPRMYSTLDSLLMLRTSILGDVTIPPANKASSEVDSTTGNLEISTLIQSRSMFTYFIQVKSKSMKDTLYTPEHTRYHPVSTSSAYLHAFSLISQTAFQLHHSQTAYATKGYSSNYNTGLSKQTSAPLTPSLLVTGNVPLENSSSLDISQVSQDKTSNADSSISSVKKLVSIKVLQDSTERTTYSSLQIMDNPNDFSSNIPTQESATRGSTVYDVSGSERTATTGISKSRYGLSTLIKTALSEGGQHHTTVRKTLDLVTMASENTSLYATWETQQRRTSSQESPAGFNHISGTISQESSFLETQSNKTSPEDSTIWKPHQNINGTKESSIWKDHSIATMRTRNESGTAFQQSSEYSSQSNSPSRKTFSTAATTISGKNVYSTSTHYKFNTSFRPSGVLLRSNYNIVRLSKIQTEQTPNEMVSAKLGQHGQQSGNSSSSMEGSSVYEAHGLFLTEVQAPSSRDAISSTTKEDILESNTHVMYSFATIGESLQEKPNSVLSTVHSTFSSSNEVTPRLNSHMATATTRDARETTSTSAMEHIPKSRNHVTFSLATGMTISYSSVITVEKSTPTGILNCGGLSTVNARTLATVVTDTVFVSSTIDKTLSSSVVTDSAAGVHPSKELEMHSSSKPYITSGAQMVIRGSVKSHHQHLGYVSTMNIKVTQVTPLTHESSSVFWSEDAGTQPAQGGSSRDSSNTLQTESLRSTGNVQGMIQETISLTVSVNRFGRSEVDGSDIASNFQGQSHSNARTTFSSPSFTMSPPNPGPSQPPTVEVNPVALQFPWNLIPFLIIIFILIVVLITYYLRIPDVIEAIILAIKDRRKRKKASKPDENLNLTKGNFAASLKVSTFHSYQRELFYDDALNYALFEKNTKAIEFSIHLDEEELDSGTDESVEISCELGEEYADKKQGHDSLSDMFDTDGSDVARSSAERNRTMYLHYTPPSYDI